MSTKEVRQKRRVKKEQPENTEKIDKLKLKVKRLKHEVQQLNMERVELCFQIIKLREEIRSQKASNSKN